MKLPFCHEMAHRIIGQAPARLSWANITSEVDSDPMRGRLVYRSSAEVFFEQTVEHSTPPNLVREHAVRAMTYHVYGPVETELRKVLHELWEDGLHDHRAAKHIEAMLPELRGDLTAGSKT